MLNPERFPVSEHLDTSSSLKLQSSMGHSTIISEKRRPQGRSSNLRMMYRLSSIMEREPVNLGEVGGGSHSLAINLGKREECNKRSSRRGKKQMKSRTRGGATGGLTRLRDVRIGDNPCN